ncbi:hypothetical protein SprV_0401660000 [Sparganum proliferum]
MFPRFATLLARYASCHLLHVSWHLSPATPFSTVKDNQLTIGAASERFFGPRLKLQQSTDDFALELGQQASLALPYLPQADRDELILPRFVTGLRDRTAMNIFLLHPPTHLATAMQQCLIPTSTPTTPTNVTTINTSAHRLAVPPSSSLPAATNTTPPTPVTGEIIEEGHTIADETIPEAPPVITSTITSSLNRQCGLDSNLFSL